MTVSQNYQRFSTINSSWALWVGLLTLMLYAGLPCQPCVTLSTELFASSLVIGLLLGLGSIGWSWMHYPSQRLLHVSGGMTVLALLAQLVLTMQPFSTSATIGHILMVVAYLTATLFAVTLAHRPATRTAAQSISHSEDRLFWRSMWLTGGSTLLLLFSGVVIRATETTLACPDWPLCQGQILPFEFASLWSVLHRFSAMALGVLVAALILQATRNYRQQRGIIRGTVLLGLLYLVQAGWGALYTFGDFNGAVGVGHLALTIAMWGTLVILATQFYGQEKPFRPELVVEPMPFKAKARLYFFMTKPWVQILLLVTTVGAMLIAAQAVPPLWLIGVTLLGGSLSAGGASVLNSYFDSDIDDKMSRTSRRPTVAGQVTPQETLFLGLTLSTLSFVLFIVFVNPLSAFLSTLGIVYYVFFYTLYLKRSTIHNIVIGGAAGAIPPLVGWAAVTNGLNLEAFYLFAIIFFWTPPHTWALAIMVKKDYARARVPMLPVVVGEKETTYQTLLYTVLLVALTLLPFAIQMMGWLYLVVVVALNGRILQLAWQLWQDCNKSTSRRLYKYSQAYLALLFLAMVLDRTMVG